MFRFLLGAAFIAALTGAAVAQSANGRVTTVAPTYTNNTTAPLSLDTGGALRTTSSLAGTFNNNADNIATSADNLKAASWIYGWDGATWDRIRGDSTNGLSVNCVVGCAGGTFNNNADNVATSATNGQSAAWAYWWDGAAWDRAPGNQTDGLLVNLGANNDVTVTSGTANVSGTVAHDGAGAAVNPLGGGCYASAAAPADVSADTDIVRAWCLRSGAGVIQPSFAGVLATTGNGASGTGVQRVTIANDSTGVLATVSTVTSVTGLTGGNTAHDAAAAAVNPLLGGCYASAAAPADVSADNDATRSWCLRSGAAATQPTFAGVLAVAGNGASGTGVQRVTVANDSTGVLAGVTTVTTLTNLTGGTTAHDGAGGAINPVATGCYASAAAPTDVSADNDITREWCLRNGARATQPTFAGVLQATGNGVAGTGTPRVTIASDNTAFSVLAIGSVAHDGAAGTVAPVLEGCYASAAAPTDVSADNDATRQWCLRNGAQVNQPSFAGVLASTGNGASGTGVQRVTIANDSTGTIQPLPSTAGGLSTYNLEPGASDNHANIKNGAGMVYHISAFSKHTAAQYLRLYNAASGFNGCNSATNLLWSGIIPGSSTGAGYVQDISMGIVFSTGISICVTGAYGQTDTTNATASVMEVNIGYK